MTVREDRPELADAGRLARKLLGRTVRMARTEDQALRRALLDHLGPNAAYLPMVSSSYPVYEHVNLQVGVDARPGDQLRPRGTRARHEHATELPAKARRRPGPDRAARRAA